jgi:hypothetical protein
MSISLSGVAAIAAIAISSVRRAPPRHLRPADVSLERRYTVKTLRICG